MLCQFHLQAALTRLSPSGENVQDQGSAVDDLRAVEDSFELKLLGRGEFIVADNGADVMFLDATLDLLKLAFTDVGVAGSREPLDDGVYNLGAGAFGKIAQFIQRVSHGPIGATPPQSHAH